MSDQPLHYWTLTEVSAAIAARTVSAVEVTTEVLNRIAQINPQLGAFYTVFTESALAEARAADLEIAAGRPRGALHGIPVALKDLIDFGPTTAGSALRRDHQAVAHGALVERLRSEGAVIVGKLATHEFGLSTQTFADAFAPARNPWDPERTPGGSSTGAGVALAAGLVFGAYGTDSGGSVRLPAANCSIVGLKPTFGLIGRSGIVPLSWSLDHAGPMARTVGDARLLLDAVRGPDPGDPGSASTPSAPTLERQEVTGIRVGVPRGFWEPGCNAEVAAAFERSLALLASLGAEVREVDLGVSLKQAVATGYLVALAEAATLHASDVRRRAGLYGREFRQLMRAGMLIPASAYINAQRARAEIARRVARVFDGSDGLGGDVLGCDVMAMPTLGALPDRIPEQPRRIDLRISTAPAPAYTWLANLYGGPAISIPAGFSTGGLPIGLQLLGRSFEDSLVLALAEAHEAAAGFLDRHPAI